MKTALQFQVLKFVRAYLAEVQISLQGGWFRCAENDRLGIPNRNHLKHLPRNTLQGTNISHLGKRKIIFKSAFLGGYVSSQEGMYKSLSNTSSSAPNHSSNLVSLPHLLWLRLTLSWWRWGSPLSPLLPLVSFSGSCRKRSFLPMFSCFFPDPDCPTDLKTALGWIWDGILGGLGRNLALKHQKTWTWHGISTDSFRI